VQQQRYLVDGCLFFFQFLKLLFLGTVFATLALATQPRTTTCPAPCPYGGTGTAPANYFGYPIQYSLVCGNAGSCSGAYFTATPIQVPFSGRYLALASNFAGDKLTFGLDMANNPLITDLTGYAISFFYSCTNTGLAQTSTVKAFAGSLIGVSGLCSGIQLPLVVPSLVCDTGRYLYQAGLGFPSGTTCIEIERVGGGATSGPSLDLDGLILTPPPEVTIVAAGDGSEVGPVNGQFNVLISSTVLVPVVVTYTVSGTATNGVDYVLLSGSITIPPSTLSVPLVIQVLVDCLVEGIETVTVTLVRGYVLKRF
jgi:hypothetical protein